MKRALSLALLCSLGCADEAILELEITYPPQTEGAAYALIEARDSAHPFAANWHPSDLENRPFQLGSEATTERVSILSDRTYEKLRIKVIFCPDENCTERHDSAPKAWFELESPFYIGEVTQWSFRFLNLPTLARTHPCPTLRAETEDPACEDSDRDVDWLIVDQCRIGGCTNGSERGLFCRMDSDRHFCEP
jgi:hypothetical protein